MTETNKEEAKLIWEALQEGSPYIDWRKHSPPPGEGPTRRGDTLTGKEREGALFNPDKWVDCPECKDGKLPDGSTCEHCGGSGRHPKPEKANEGESLDDWNDYMNAEGENTAGYIQIDLYTGSVQTVSPDQVQQAVRGLDKVGPDSGDSDWDAWRGEEYMVVAIPRTVHWPKSARSEPVPDHSDLIQPTKY